MNIIYVGDCGPKPSGAPISSDQLIRKLATRGCRVRALTPVLAAGDPDMPVFDAARPEIEAIHYPVPSYFTDPFDPRPADWEGDKRRHRRRVGTSDRRIASRRADGPGAVVAVTRDVGARHGVPGSRWFAAIRRAPSSRGCFELTSKLDFFASCERLTGSSPSRSISCPVSLALASNVSTASRTVST